MFLIYKQCFYLKEVESMSDNYVEEVLKNSSDVSFLSIDEVQALSKESYDSWISEYVLRLKRIFQNNISKCAQNGEFNYIFESDIMTTNKVEDLVKSIEKEIIPLLNGYSINFLILTQPDNFNYSRLKVCISWE